VLLLLLMVVRPVWDMICSSPGAVAAMLLSHHLVLLLLLMVGPVWDIICSSPGAVFADDGETLLGCDLFLTWCCCCYDPHLVLLLLMMVRPFWDMICSSPGAVAAKLLT
jgi:hypothetical protein